MGNRLGFTLIEVILVIVVLSIGLTGVLSYVTQAAQDSAYAHNISVATTLAQDLMEEIRSKCWDETATTAAPCAGTVVPSAIGSDAEGRGAYDDVDDFNDLPLGGNTPPQDSQGVGMGTFPYFTQRAAVCYVDVAALDTCVAGPTNFKRVSVNISWSAADQVELVSVFTNR